MSRPSFDLTLHRSELESVQYAATAAHHATMNPPEAPRGFITEAWQELFQRNQLPQGPEGKLAAAKEALAVMTAISNLAPQHYRALAEREHCRAAGLAVDFVEEAKAVALAIASSPVLAKFMGEVNKAKEKRAAEIEANRQAAEAQRLRDLPGASLARWRERGLVFGLTDNDQVTVLPRNHGLSASEIDLIRQRLPDFVALVRAEIQAASPVIIA